MIRILNRQRKYEIDRAGLTKLAGCVLEEVGRSHSEATIVFVGERAIRQLNRRFRGIDHPTDVLAFCYESGPHVHGGEREDYLGDVVISPGTAWQHAARFRISPERELKNLVIHGLLHLCGYDHETDDGEMKRLERSLRRRWRKRESAEPTESPKRQRIPRGHSQSRR